MTFHPTEDQRRAIEHADGDLFIAAGAGSGKTAVLARRFAHAVKSGAAPDEILTITFTRKAAGEVADRIRRVLRYEEGRPADALAVQHAWVSTIHGLCSRLLRRHSLEAGVVPGFRVLDPVEADLLREQSFEQIAAASRGDEGFDALAARYDSDLLHATVLSLHSKLRSLGGGPADLGALPVPRLAPALKAARAALSVALAEHSEPPRNATQAANAPLLRAALDALDSLGDEPGDDDVCRILDAVPPRSLQLHCPATKTSVAEAKSALQAIADVFLGREAAAYAETLRSLLSRFDERYRLLKDQAGALDADDLQERVRELFEARPEIASEYAEHFRMLMVDEFQDTNELQLAVIDPLRRDDLCVVGDDRQAIYSFRDADVEVFRRVRGGIAAGVSLDANFRSHPDVLAFVNVLFADPALFDDFTPLVPGRSVPTESGPRVELLLAGCGGCTSDQAREAEATALAERLAELVESGEAKASDIVVLLRSFTNSGTYTAALEAVGLRAVEAAGGSFAKQREIVELEALLAVAALPYDEEALAVLLLGDLAGLSAAALRRLAPRRGERIAPLWGRLTALTEDPAGLPVVDAERLTALVAAVTHIRTDVGRGGIGDALLGACRILGVEQTLAARPGGAGRAWGNARKLAAMAETFSAQHGADLGAFVEHLRMLRRMGGVQQAAPETADAVRLMTVHGAKGLEFPVVVVADLGSGLRSNSDTVLVERVGDRFEWSMKMPESKLLGPKHEPAEWCRMQQQAAAKRLDEQKRLLYVACTRAEERLILSGTTKLTEPEKNTPMGWVRQALDLERAVGEPGRRVSDGAEWLLRVVEAPAESGEVSEPASAERSAAPSHRDTTAGSDLSAPRARPAAPETPLPPRSLSFTALKTFASCPYRFHTERVLRLRSANAARPPALAFGEAFHLALEAEAESAALPEREARLARIAESLRLPAEDARRLGAAVEAFARSSAAKRALAGERVAREVPFAFPLGDTRLSGSMDLVSWNGAAALVLDYKTGKLPSNGKTLAEEYRLQAECYAAALFASGAERVEVAFVAVEQDAAVSSAEFVAEDAPRLRERLEALARAACEGPYGRLERYDQRTCGGCVALGGLCGISAPDARRSGAA